MQRCMPKQTNQMLAASAVLNGVMGDALLAVYLHGLAISGKLRPVSDARSLCYPVASLTSLG
jgi:streptomycin 3"-adenylyltransferase